MRLHRFAGILILLAAPVFSSSSSSGLAPPGLHPLVVRGDALLSAGQFSDAAKAYSEAILLSPADYLLFYKRATAYFSLSRHASALDDFAKVLALTGGEFDPALMMTAKIHTKDGDWSRAKQVLASYSTKLPGDQAANDMLYDISEAETAASKAGKARRAQLWTVCSEAATQALRVASHSFELRQTRADCNLASGDVQGAVLDLTLAKSLDKGFSKLTKLMEANDWKGVLKHIVGSAKDFPGDGFALTFDVSLLENGTPDMLAPSSSKLPPPNVLSTSPRRAFILHAACRAYLKLNDLGASPKKGFDGSDVYTLPVLHDPNTGALVDDSLGIAVYLEKAYPAKPIFPYGSKILIRVFDSGSAYLDGAHPAVRLILLGKFSPEGPKRDGDWTYLEQCFNKGEELRAKYSGRKQPKMSYDQTQASRRNDDDDSNYDPSGQTRDIDAGGDSTRSGAHGGSGFGQAGGYTGSQGYGEGAGGDNYSQTDPGMAGNRGFRDIRDIQDLNVGGPMGGEQDTGSYGQTLGGQGRSRGYERDNDEYDDSGFGQGQGQGQDAGTGRAPKSSMGSKVL
ncbi:hypothetical protein M405DRAFT_840225, partial [Rhizopogon salebrosus TDB-379]